MLPFQKKSKKKNNLKKGEHEKYRAKTLGNTNDLYITNHINPKTIQDEKLQDLSNDP